VGGERAGIKVGQVDLPGRRFRRRDIVERQAIGQQRMRNRAIGQPGVEVGEMVEVGKPAGERTLAGRGGAVDGEEQGGQRGMPFNRFLGEASKFPGQSAAFGEGGCRA